MKSKAKTSNKKSSSAPQNIPSLRKNLLRSVGLVRKNKKTIGLITLIYGILYFLLIRVLTTVDYEQLRASVIISFGGSTDNLWTQVISIGSLFGQSTRFDEQTGLMFGMITIICSLALIWVLRKAWDENRTTTKEAFYKGMYPLVPIILILLWMIVQAIPFSLGTFVFQNAFQNGLASTFLERVFFVSVFAAGIITSAYLILGSIIALYGATVPGVTPSEARKAARKMLAGRRFAVLRQVILFMVLTAVLLLVPMLLVVWLWQAAVVVFAALMLILTLPWFHLYFYGLYRDLIDE